MEALRTSRTRFQSFAFTWVLLAFLSGCGATVTKVDYLETDTYISSADPASHAESPVLKVSRSGSLEERTLVKLPTGKRDEHQNLDKLLENPLSAVLFPYYIVTEIFQAFFSCTQAPLAAASLQSSKLVLGLNSSSDPALTGKLSLSVLSAPWYQTANWDHAHVFSSKGRWTSPGGDPDPAFASVAGTQTSDGKSVEFVVTEYFRTLLSQSNPVHYGMLIKAEADISSVAFNSVQAVSSDRPKLVSVYLCPTGTGFLTTSEYVLGPEHREVEVR